MPFPYVTAEEVEDRIGRTLVARALDDDGDGDPDPVVIAALVNAACSRVRSRITRTLPSVSVTELESAVEAPEELKRLSVAAFRIELMQRAPGVFPDQLWEPMERSLLRQLDDWSAGVADLGGEPPENEAQRAGVALRTAVTGRGW